MHRVFNLSGGHSSALMTLLGNPTNNDIVLFTDTGREHLDTYRFIDDFEKYEGIKVHRAFYPGGFSPLIAKRKFLPNQKLRICTSELKILTAKRYLSSLGIQRFENHIGFRADEQRRIISYKNQYKKVIPRFLLNEYGITKSFVDLYWSSKPYRLNIPDILKNCDLCFQKGKSSLITIMQHHPEYAEKWISDEKKIGSTFINGISYSQLLHIAKNTPKKDLGSALPAFSCTFSS